MKTKLLPLVAGLFLAAGSTSGAELVTRGNMNDLAGGGHSSTPVLSADGHWLVFLSHANNLVPNDDRNEWLDVFARDLKGANTNILVSVAFPGVGGGNGNSAYASISSNGQFVVFASEADNLVPDDTNGVSDIFLRDLSAGTTTLLSATADGVAGSGHSSRSQLSANNRWVVFESRATNLVPNTDALSTRHILRRDLQSEAIELVSVPLSSLANAPETRSWNPMISGDGRFVAFLSTALNLAEGVSASLGDVYLRDHVEGTNYWVSAGLPGGPGSYRCRDVAISEDGRFVAFTVFGSTSAIALYRYDVENDTLEVVSESVTDRAPQISADGRYLIFEDGSNVFRWDAATTNAEVVNVTSNGTVPTNGIARFPVMSPNGNGVAFTSDSPEMTPGITGGVFQVYLRNMSAASTRLISARDDQASSEATELSSIAVANDLAWVAFDSTASDLVDGDGNAARDVFVRNITDETTRLVSERLETLPRTTGLGHAYVTFGGVSSNGQVVAFTSFNTDLAPGDTNGWSDLFVYNQSTGETRTPGIDTNASLLPMVSLDGRYAVYVRGRPSLSAGLLAPAVHRFDIEGGTDLLVTNLQPGSSLARPAISADGRYVAYHDRSSSQFILLDVAHGTNGWTTNVSQGLFLRLGDDRDARFTPDSRFVLYASATTLFAFDLATRSLHAITNINQPPIVAVSGNSRLVAFTTTPARQVVIYDLIQQTRETFDMHFVSFLSLNHDGRYLVAETQASLASSEPSYVLLLDRETGQTNVVVRKSRQSFYGLFPQITPDGRYVVCRQSPPDVPGAPINGRTELHLRDLLLGTTTTVAPMADGPFGTAQVSAPVLSADGRTVLFHSVANNLVAGDYNDKRDVFRLSLSSSVDSDGDGLDDDWEVAFFNDLSRDGTGNFDNDGHTDWQEFLTGTDPTNSESILRVLTVTPLLGDETQIIWQAVPGRSYRVEYKDDLANESWNALSGSIVWNETTASLLDPTPATNRFYRVVRLP